MVVDILGEPGGGCGDAVLMEWAYGHLEHDDQTDCQRDVVFAHTPELTNRPLGSAQPMAISPARHR